MDVAKENPPTIFDRTNGKGNMITFSASKRLTALSDVRNTVHKKHFAESCSVKQFLEIERRRDLELETTSPCRKQTPLVKRPAVDVSSLQKNLDEDITACRCNLNDEVFEDDFLPEGFGFNDADIDNLKKIWLGQGGHEEENKYIFSPLKISRSDLDLEALVEKPDFNISLSNDSGIELDIDLELNEINRDFQFLL